METDFTHLQHQVMDNGIEMYLTERYGDGQVKFLGRDAAGKVALVQKADGAMTSIDLMAIKRHLQHKELEANNTAINDTIHDVKATLAKDLSAIGVDESMLQEGAINPRLLTTLERNGYPVKRIQQDFERLRELTHGVKKKIVGYRDGFGNKF
jgi:hypothetical protein